MKVPSLRSLWAALWMPPPHHKGPPWERLTAQEPVLGTYAKLRPGTPALTQATFQKDSHM